MSETWLKPNRRILTAALALPLAAALFGGWLLAAGGRWSFWSGFVLLVAAGLSAGWLIRKMFCPRLAYRRGQLFVGLSGGDPIGIPIELVECFFLGRAETVLSGKAGLESRALAIVIRLSEVATDYQSQPLKSSLGVWKDGYITVRGTWCEPISGPLVVSLNESLSRVQRLSESQQQLASGRAREEQTGG
jgi:hypothetical protein